MIDLNSLSVSSLAALFDHTNLKAAATEAEMAKLCKEAAENGFAMVAVNSCQVKRCRAYLEGTGVHVGAAVSFPLGQTDLSVKLFETENAIDEGADEIDYVLNVGRLKDGDLSYIEEEMERITALCRARGVISKCIFETCYLTEEEIREAAGIAKRVKPDFIKTSTGFGTAGATAAHVRHMKETEGEWVRVKAAGDIRSL